MSKLIDILTVILMITAIALFFVIGTLTTIEIILLL